MTIHRNDDLLKVYGYIKEYFRNSLTEFWLHKSIDNSDGGYLVDFDGNGRFKGTNEKYLVTQTRLLYAFSAFSRYFKDKNQYLSAAEHGFRFLVEHFWDNDNGGWIWKTDNRGKCLDNGKVIYGQSFAVYALCEYYLASGDKEALEYAEKTFHLLQVHAADNLYGGYFENFKGDWEIEGGGKAAGDRKSLDIHMHLLEAFTKLYQCRPCDLYKRKLYAIMEILYSRMIHPEYGCGLNQFDREWNSIPPVTINRTWNSDREDQSVKSVEEIMTTSYGHNMELLWLTRFAFEVLGENGSKYNNAMSRLSEHTIKYGIDKKYGGVYRDGPYNGGAIIRDKEWWQQSESLVGFLYAWELFGKNEYIDAFLGIWSFVKDNMINTGVGEWYPLVSRSGTPKWTDMGNPWKAAYHTGRSMMETSAKLCSILAGGELNES